jgi:hypothetical protein
MFVISNSAYPKDANTTQNEIIQMKVLGVVHDYSKWLLSHTFLGNNMFTFRQNLYYCSWIIKCLERDCNWFCA